MSVPSAIQRHTDRVDHCLRGLTDVLRTRWDEIQDAARRTGTNQQFSLTADGGFWKRLYHALANAEPWPMDFNGPVSVLWRAPEDEPGAPTPMRLAYFTRGDHPADWAIAHLKRAARDEGIRLLERNVPPNSQVFTARWVPPDPAKEKHVWGTQALAGDLDAVPVTVWVPADGTTSAQGAGASPSPGATQETP